MRKKDSNDVWNGKGIGWFRGLRKGWNLLVLDDEVWFFGWKERRLGSLEAGECLFCVGLVSGLADLAYRLQA